MNTLGLKVKVFALLLLGLLAFSGNATKTAQASCDKCVGIVVRGAEGFGCITGGTLKNCIATTSGCTSEGNC